MNTVQLFSMLLMFSIIILAISALIVFWKRWHLGDENKNAQNAQNIRIDSDGDGLNSGNSGSDIDQNFQTDESESDISEVDFDVESGADSGVASSVYHAKPTAKPTNTKAKPTELKSPQHYDEVVQTKAPVVTLTTKNDNNNTLFTAFGSNNLQDYISHLSS